MKFARAALVAAVTFAFSARGADQLVPLTGPWSFAMDPMDRGEQFGWAKPDAGWKGDKPHVTAGWDSATVPHDFLSDPRFAFTGVGWYRRSFEVPAGASGLEWRLQFEQVSQRCRVWLNGTLVGTHEGGYTPFELIVTPEVKPGRFNFLVVAVDNRIRARSLPGARTGSSINSQVFPWLNYGGILGDAMLVGHAPVYVVSQQIQATPALPVGPAAIIDHIRVRNATAQPQTAHLSVALASRLELAQDVSLPAQSEQVVTLRGELPAEAVRLWTVDAQPLFPARATLHSAAGDNSREDNFGIRTLAARDGKFLVNDRPVRFAGANRARGHPTYGGKDPDEAVEQDMRLMKAAGLRLARLQHTPPHRNLLDWADRNGMLIILEVGVWGYPAADLASPELRTQFQSEMRELMQLAVNHPSVVGWSVGNEYESWTPAGVAWTHDMAAFLRGIDPSRPITFAALGTAVRKVSEDPAGTAPHAFDDVDLISTNLYFGLSEVGQLLDAVHARWPAKPILITEFGLRADRVKDERERLTNFDQMLAIVRARPWICGMSFWSFNDYPSHYPGTGADGYRRWGLVDEFRHPRPLYEHVRATIGSGLDSATRLP